jgi:hypothetical protein
MKWFALMAATAGGLAMTAVSASAGSVDFTTGPGSQAASYSFVDSDGINVTATAGSNNTDAAPQVSWNSDSSFIFTNYTGGLGVDSGIGQGVPSFIPLPPSFDLAPHEVNNFAFHETLWLTFDAPVDLNSITFGQVSAEFLGFGGDDYKVVDLGGNELASGHMVGDNLFQPLATVDFTGLNSLTTFGIQATGLSSFTVRSLNVSAAAAAVPLPAAVWSGLGMLGLLGAGAMRKKGRALLTA